VTLVCGAGVRLPIARDWASIGGIDSEWKRQIAHSGISQPIGEAGAVEKSGLIAIANTSNQPTFKLAIVGFADHFGSLKKTTRNRECSKSAWEENDTNFPIANEMLPATPCLPVVDGKGVLGDQQLSERPYVLRWIVRVILGVDRIFNGGIAVWIELNHARANGVRRIIQANQGSLRNSQLFFDGAPLQGSNTGIKEQTDKPKNLQPEPSLGALISNIPLEYIQAFKKLFHILISVCLAVILIVIGLAIIHGMVPQFNASQGAFWIRLYRADLLDSRILVCAQCVQTVNLENK
jgi:hypothetical protein